MSELAYSRFMASYMLTAEEQLPENKVEIIDYSDPPARFYHLTFDEELDAPICDCAAYSFSMPPRCKYLLATAILERSGECT
jgi:hypothetical protein